jgi:hypothetical protein
MEKSTKEREVGSFLKIDLRENWPTNSTGNVPHITHSSVEDYFKLVGDKRHITQGWAGPQINRCCYGWRKGITKTNKAEVEPSYIESHAMKREPLQEIVFEKPVLSRDVDGGRKRRLPCELFASYKSQLCGKPPVNKADIEGLYESLKYSKSSKVLINVLEENIKCNK